MARIITITSGEDGVGKTSFSLNLSLSLASAGFKVCLFDADSGLSNINIFTGIHAKKNLESVTFRQSDLKDIIIKDYKGIDIIPGGSGIKKITHLTREQTHTLVNEFLNLEDYDYFIIDTSCDAAFQALSFCMASHETILVTTCEPASLTCAYSMLKKLSKYHYRFPVNILINQAQSGSLAQKAYKQLKEIVNKFLPVKIKPLGTMASDKNASAAVIAQTPFFVLFPDTIASRCIKSITRKLLDKKDQTQNIPLELFWDKSLYFLKKHRTPEKKPDTQTVYVEKGKEQDPEIKKTLFHIQSRLSALTKEMNDIKKSLVIHGSPPNKSKEKETKPPLPNEISLDFESWLEKKYK